LTTSQQRQGNGRQKLAETCGADQDADLPVASPGGWARPAVTGLDYVATGGRLTDEWFLSPCRHDPERKELRPGSVGASEIPMIFAFGPAREAIFLVAGDKSGRWQSWHRSAIRLADARFTEYLATSSTFAVPPHLPHPGQRHSTGALQTGTDTGSWSRR
jgi:hypothetical protein